MVGKRTRWNQAAVLLIVPLFAAACGSSNHAAPPAPPTATQVVRGPGFHFSAPKSWTVKQDSNSASALTRDKSKRPVIVSVAIYKLGKAYSPDKFDAAVPELDTVAVQLAAAEHGKVTSSETTTLAGRKIRAYHFNAKPVSLGAYSDKVGFLLTGKREIQLLCQAPASNPDPAGACALLFDTFTLTG